MLAFWSPQKEMTSRTLVQHATVYSYPRKEIELGRELLHAQ